MEFVYQSRAGVRRLTVESYSFDPAKGNLVAHGVALYDAAGVPVGQLRSVYVSGLKIFSGSTSTIAATASGLKGDVVRDASGKFELLDYLPQAGKSASTTAFSVRLVDADIRLIDLASSDRWAEPVHVRTLRVDGIGADFIAEGDWSIPQVGSGTTIVQRSGGDLAIHLDSAGLNVVPLLAHFRTMPEAKTFPALKDMVAASLRTSGPIDFVLPTSRPADVVARVTADGGGLHIANWADVDTVHFEGTISRHGIIGKLLANRGSTRLAFDGSASWAKALQVAGHVDARVGRLADLPKRLTAALPKDLAIANAAVTGDIRYAPGAKIWWNGTGSADQIAYGRDSATRVKVSARSVSDGFAVNLLSGQVLGSEITGDLSYGWSGGSVSGWVKSPRIDIGTLAKRYGWTGLKGVLSADVSVSGTRQQPKLAIIAQGSGLRYRNKSGRDFNLGVGNAAATYNRGKVNVERLTLVSPTGAIAATGGADTLHKILSLAVSGRAIELGSAFKDWTGTGVFDGRVGGSFSDPRFMGHAEAFGVGTQGLTAPVVTADVAIDRRSAGATNVRVAKGAAFASGEIGVRFSDGALHGTADATSLSLADLIGPEFAGLVDVSSATFGGTLTHPIAQAKVSSGTNLIRGVKIDSTTADASLRDSQLFLNNLVLKAGGGLVTGSAQYDLRNKSGSIGFAAADVGLAQLLPVMSDQVAVSGQVGATGKFSIDSARNVAGGAHLTFKGIQLNGTLVGQGSADVSAAGSSVTGTAQIGFLDRYVEVPSMRYDTSTKNIDGRVVFYNFLLKDLYTSSERYLPAIDPQIAYRLERLGGNLNADVGLRGPISGPDVDVRVLDASGVAYDGTSFGSVHAVATRQGKTWQIGALDYVDLDATLHAKGSIVEDGAIAFGGTLNHLDLAKMSKLSPALVGLGGIANSTFAVSGQTAKPVVRASVDSPALSYDPGNGRSPIVAAVNLDTIQVSESRPDGTGGISVEGDFTYRGLLGTVKGAVPLRYPFEIPRDAPISAGISLPRRNLSTLFERKTVAGPRGLVETVTPLIPGIDLKSSVGSIGGNVAVSGTLDAPHVTGKVDLLADKLVLEGNGESWSAATAVADLSDRKIALTGRASGSHGGTAEANVTASIQSVGDLIDALRLNGIDSLLDDSIDGSVRLNALRIDQKLEGNGRVAGTADSNVAIGGTIRAPTFNGTVKIGHADILSPSGPLPIGGTTGFTINPRFGIDLSLADPMRFRTSTSEFVLNGGGRVQGRLSRPDIQANFDVLSGSIRLPTAKVKVDPAGTIAFAYQISPTGVGQARANVNLVGRTSLTARETSVDTGGLVQRYAITLGITGDLFQDRGLILRAESDPPGLDQDRILRLLGQADLFAVLGTSLNRDEANRRIRDAVGGYALPIVFDPITSKLAASLGLDYLSIEYNTFEQATFSFAKSLGKGFEFSGRRQLSQPLPGLRALYDFRLTYRLPFSNKLLKRVTVGIGIDQDRPWKISVEYGFRF